MKNCLICLGLLISSLSTTAQVTTQRLYDTLPNMQEHYAKRVAQFEKEAVVTGQTIFLGNSITEGGSWAELTGDQGVINRGISGDITYTVLKRLDDIIKRKPSKLFILIGINDISKDIPEAVIADNCRKIVQRIKMKSPETRIFLQSVLPINPTYPGFPQHYDKENQVIRTNELLREVAASTQSRFINLYPLFLDDQQHLEKKFTYDGLHLNRKGYEIWSNFLKQNGFL